MANENDYEKLKELMEFPAAMTLSLIHIFIAECKKAGYETFGEEGRNTADWIVVDLGQTIVHIMQRDAREMYQLEKLWA